MYFALISAVLTTVVFLMSGDAGTWEFAARVAAASLTSFGGGEAFIGVADAFFVQSGFVSEQVYYSRIIGVSSAMPGPVLMSIAAGVGFAFGSAIGGVGTGWMFGMLAIALSVAATALGALLLYTCFKVFSDSIRLKMTIKYMMPIVCGLLITIFLSLFYQAVTVFSREGISPLIGACLVLVFLAAMYVLRMRFRLKDVPLLLAGGCSSLLLLLLII
jgi:chromate transporter